MPKELKRPSSVYIYASIIEHMESNNPEFKSLAEWINIRYPEEFMNIKNQEKRVQKLEKDLEDEKKNLKRLQEAQDKLIIPKLAEEWIKNEGAKRLEKHNQTAVLRWFNGQFNVKLSASQFRFFINKHSKK